MRETVFQVFAFLLGSLIGSFANVCIYRLPRNLRITTPRSRCVRCGTMISWYDNIPLVSYFVLRGRCRQCASKFGFGHVVVEFLVALIAWWIYRTEGLHLQSVYLFVVATALVIVSGIDLEHRIIPDSISLNGIWIGLLLAGVAAWLGIDWFVTFKDALWGVLIGGGLLWGLLVGYEQITGREGMGLGDVKLVALFGAHGGVLGALTAVFFGAFFGSVVGVGMMVFQGKGSRTPIPFGPFLCAGLLIYALGGQRWVLELFQGTF
jgi:leader peptidase (prepilin peptidase) / N-methyltransferase